MKKKILVLMGGISTEREVSLRSGKAVTEALTEAGFDAVALDLTEKNLHQIQALRPDTVFNALHGKGGEDGSIQGFLEWLNLPYTGPGVAASAVCIDKILTKKLLRDSGIPTPRFLEIAESEKDRAEEKAKKALLTLGLPLVLKASCQGSSIGTVIVREEAELLPALEGLFSYQNAVLAEEFLPGMELTVPILGNSELTVLPVIEICAKGEFYDYQSKYTVGGSEHVIPARLSPEAMEKVRRLAAEAYRATGCRGYARVDMMLSGEGEPFVIEINTSPGMTETSLFPDAARFAGISFPELVRRIVALAEEENESKS